MDVTVILVVGGRVYCVHDNSDVVSDFGKTQVKAYLVLGVDLFDMLDWTEWADTVQI